MFQLHGLPAYLNSNNDAVHLYVVHLLTEFAVHSACACAAVPVAARARRPLHKKQSPAQLRRVQTPNLQLSDGNEGHASTGDARSDEDRERRKPPWDIFEVEYACLERSPSLPTVQCPAAGCSSQLLATHRTEGDVRHRVGSALELVVPCPA